MNACSVNSGRSINVMESLLPNSRGDGDDGTGCMASMNNDVIVDVDIEHGNDMYYCDVNDGDGSGDQSRSASSALHSSSTTNLQFVDSTTDHPLSTATPTATINLIQPVESTELSSSTTTNNFTNNTNSSTNNINNNIIINNNNNKRHTAHCHNENDDGENNIHNNNTNSNDNANNIQRQDSPTAPLFPISLPILVPIQLEDISTTFYETGIPLPQLFDADSFALHERRFRHVNANGVHRFNNINK